MSSSEAQVRVQIQNGRFSLVASFSLLILEWLATFPSEVEHLHNVVSQWSSIRITFVLCRYYPLLTYPIFFWAYFEDFNMQQCSHVTRLVYALHAPSHFLGPVVMMLRAYAFSGRKYKTRAFLSCCYGIFFAVGVWVFWASPPGITSGDWQWYEHLGRARCYPWGDASVTGLRIGFVIGSSTVMDFVSLSVVVIYCRKDGMDGWSLGKYFVTQGLCSFVFVTIVNAVATTMYFQPNGSISLIGLPFVIIINNITACRLILQLREKAMEMEFMALEPDLRSEYTLTVPTRAGSQLTNVDMWSIDNADAELLLVSSEPTV
ncbi:hypothetical protein BDN72DRAFT_905600 [Pluteus cervinus]|uniref:Uncharacterized protein n=1 Tax=Pluteus cervinus TaxID=181527 RepID=A0ACD3A4D4_9AGAR|nr:hypothetical protein BDN72DRAFT_905600 [Pluteus cervinus]